MRKWSLTVMLLLALGAAPLPASAQTARAQQSANTDLDARLAQAQAQPELGQTLLATGRKVAAVCMNCHGESGNSEKPGIPSLAGQNPAYLLEQLRQFADGRRRNEFMEGMIRAMKSDEKVGMVLFYSGQTLAPQQAGKPALVAQGRAYYGKVCFRCHGEDGRGNARIPRIAGQQAAYVQLTLQRYRAGIGVRSDPLMAANTRLMSDADIEAVAAAVAAMP